MFLDYWEAHGGLPQQGYPISEEFTEISELDGKSYTVQYFERAVFEKHPENPPPYNVLLSQLGTFQYKAKYGEGGAPDQRPNMQSGQLFSETGFYVGGAFLDYWNKHGGLPQQGFPISNEFTEVSELDGKPYTVQYFERAVFELHTENAPPYNVLLSQLGTFQLKKKYPGGPPGGGAQPQPTAPPGPQPSPQPTNTSTGTNCDPVPDSRKSSVANTGPVAISKVQYSGQEYVELSNTGGTTVDLSRWILRDKNDQDQQYRFPEGTQLAAGSSIQVYTEPGHPYSFNSRSSIWNNCGDALELLDSSGAVVATYAYGTHVR
ncbi:MAG: lamin tail domain-containing protein [Chloroflexia bacterium]